MAAGGRLNRARTGNLQQSPCQGSSAVNESCYMNLYLGIFTVATIMLICRQLALLPGVRQLKQHAGLKQGFVSFRPLLPIFTSLLHDYYLL